MIYRNDIDMRHSGDETATDWPLLLVVLRLVEVTVEVLLFPVLLHSNLKPHRSIASTTDATVWKKMEEYLVAGSCQSGIFERLSCVPVYRLFLYR